VTEAQKDYKKEMGKLRTCLGSMPSGVESEIEQAREEITNGLLGTQATLEAMNGAINRVADEIKNLRMMATEIADTLLIQGDKR
jgi:uncharacterized protein (DUF885 family)